MAFVGNACGQRQHKKLLAGTFIVGSCFACQMISKTNNNWFSLFTFSHVPNYVPVLLIITLIYVCVRIYQINLHLDNLWPLRRLFRPPESRALKTKTNKTKINQTKCQINEMKWKQQWEGARAEQKIKKHLSKQSKRRMRKRNELLLADAAYECFWLAAPCLLASVQLLVGACWQHESDVAWMCRTNHINECTELFRLASLNLNLTLLRARKWISRDLGDKCNCRRIEHEY